MIYVIRLCTTVYGVIREWPRCKLYDWIERGGLPIWGMEGERAGKERTREKLQKL